jgi:RNA polymerase sigma-70 factor (ECF subfamily)
MNSVNIQNLITEYHDRLYLFSLYLTQDQSDAEDLLQDAYESILKSKISFNASKGSFATWAKQIIRNKFIDQKRKKRFLSKDIDIDLIESKTNETVTENQSLDKQLFVKRFVDELDEPDKSIIRLKIYEKKTLDQTAESLGLNRRTISRRYAKILLILKQAIEGIK